MAKNSENALWIEIKDSIGAIRDISTEIALQRGSISHIEQFRDGKRIHLYLEIEGLRNLAMISKNLGKLNSISSVTVVPTFKRIYGKRVIVIGGGAQVAEVAKGAISEADRHNIRGEKISVDTIPLVGENEIANAVRAVARLPRARILILAGSLMGGEITKAVKELQKTGIPVISLNMAGSVPKAADIVVSDPIQAGVMAVMAIADTAKFDISMQKGRRY